MDFREYPYQISLNTKIERKAKKRKEAKHIKKEKNQNIFFIICTKKTVFYGGWHKIDKMQNINYNANDLLKGTGSGTYLTSFLFLHEYSFFNLTSHKKEDFCKKNW